MLAMKNGRELRTKQQNQTRDIAPRQNGNDCSHRSVNLVVVKVVQTPRKNVFRQLPQNRTDDRAR